VGLDQVRTESAGGEPLTSWRRCKVAGMSRFYAEIAFELAAAPSAVETCDGHVEPYDRVWGGR